MKPQSSNGRRDDRGAVAVLFAIFLVVFMVLAAFVVDLGGTYVKRAQLQNAADAAALAGGSLLDCQNLGNSAARSAALNYAADNGVPNSDTTVTFPSSSQIVVSTSGVYDTFFGGFVGRDTIATQTLAAATRDCTENWQFVADVDFNFNGQGANVAGSIFAGSCFDGNKGTFGTIAVSKPSTYDCGSFHSGDYPIYNGQTNENGTDCPDGIGSCRYSYSITSAQAFSGAGYKTAGVNDKTYIDSLFTGAPNCSTINAASFSSRIVCNGNLNFPNANITITKDILVSGNIVTDNTKSQFGTSTFSGNLVSDQVLVYSRTGQVDLKMNAVPAKVVVYAPTAQSNGSSSIVYEGSGAGLYGTLLGSAVTLNGGNATSGLGVPLFGLGSWRLTQ